MYIIFLVHFKLAEYISKFSLNPSLHLSEVMSLLRSSKRNLCIVRETHKGLVITW